MDNSNALGLDIGGTHLRIARISGRGEILERVQYASDSDMVARIEQGIKELGDSMTRAVGIAVAGVVDKKNRRVTRSPNLPAVEKIDLVRLVGDTSSLPVYIENDANAAALGEKYMGRGREVESFVFLTLGTGIGGGIIHNGQLLEVPAEIGHMTVEPGGVQCDCGNHGCLEEYAAAKAMINMSTSALESGAKSSLRACCEGNIYRITPRLIYEHAMDGDNLAREVLRDAGRHLGIAMASLANIFNPEAFILAGGLSNARNFYIEEAVREAGRRALPGMFEKTMVMVSEINEDAGLIGAALHALFSLKTS